MNTLKRNNMMAAYKGFAGEQTVQAIISQIPAELIDRCTGRVLGIMMDAINAAYHNGKASLGVDVIDDCLWLHADGSDEKGKLLPLDILQKIEINETTTTDLRSCKGRMAAPLDCDKDGKLLSLADVSIARANNGEGAYYRNTDHITTYTLDVTERV